MDTNEGIGIIGEEDHFIRTKGIIDGETIEIARITGMINGEEEIGTTIGLRRIGRSQNRVHQETEVKEMKEIRGITNRERLEIDEIQTQEREPRSKDKKNFKLKTTDKRTPNIHILTWRIREEDLFSENEFQPSLRPA